MINRSTLALVVLVLSACQPWKVVREGDTNPLAGKTSFGLQWLEWAGVWVDGVPEESWMASHSDWQRDWPGNKSVGAAAFHKGVADRLAGGPLKLLTAPDPSGASAILKPSMLELSTGGWNPTVVKISVKVLDGTGAPLEEISTVVKSKRDGSFEVRLSEAATAAGANVARYLEQRAQ